MVDFDSFLNYLSVLDVNSLINSTSVKSDTQVKNKIGFCNQINTKFRRPSFVEVSSILNNGDAVEL